MRANGRYRRALIAYPDPGLAAERVGLRRWHPHDLPLVADASHDRGLVRATTLPDPYSDVEGLAFIERQWSRAASGAGLSLAIEETRAARAVGGASLMLRRPGVADLGYWLLRDARGRGLARETVELLVPWALDALGVEAIEAFVQPENRGSRRLLETCGFVITGSEWHEVGRISDELLVYRRDR